MKLRLVFIALLRVVHLVTLAVTLGCASTSKMEKKSQATASTPVEGTWSAKAQITDLKTQKKYFVDLEIAARYPEAMRMEVNGTLGVSLASLVMKNNKISYILPRQKRWYVGSVNEKSLRPMFAFDLDPRVFLSMCFDRSPEASGWECHKNSAGQLEQCEDTQNQLKVRWSERKAESKRVIVSGPQFEVNTYFKDYSPKVENPDETFRLREPDNYTKHNLN